MPFARDDPLSCALWCKRLSPAIDVNRSGHIGALLSQVRTRLRLRQAVWNGAMVGAMAGSMAWVMLLAFGRMGVRGWAGWGTLALALGSVLAAVLRPLWRWRSDDAVARAIDEHLRAHAGPGDLILSAVQLERLLPQLKDEPTASPELAEALIRQVDERARRLDARRLVELRLSRRRWWALAGMLSLYGVSFLTPAGRWLRVALALERAPVPAAQRASEPLVGDLEVRLAYPGYLQLPPRTITGSSGEVLAPRGTKVELRGRLLLPAQRAELLLELDAGTSAAPAAAPQPQADVPQVAVEEGRLVARFTVTGAGAYRFVLHTEADEALREADGHRITVEVDRPPRVDLRAPADDLEVTQPRSRIELAYSAEDDHGLGPLELVWRIQDHEQRLAVREGAGVRQMAGTWEWDLAEVDLRPGVRVSYWLEVKDNDNIGGPNLGRSRTLYLHLYSAAQKHDEMLGREQVLLDHAVQLLGDRIDGEWLGPRKDGQDPVPLSGGNPATIEFERRGALHAASGRFIDELGSLLGALDKDPLAGHELRVAAGEMHQRLARLHRTEERELRSLSSRVQASRVPGETVTSAALRGLREANPRHVSELERDVLLLDDFLQRQRLEQLLALSDEMARARDRLKKLLAQYKNSHSEALRQEIERELRQLEQKLAELESKAAQLGGRVPDEFLNREALADSNMRQRLDALREMLARGDVDQALSELDRLSRTLDQVAQSFEGGLRGYRNDRFSEEERSLAELESRLADLEHDERELAAETEKVRSRYQQATEQHVRERVEPFLKKALEQVAELQKKVDAIDPRLLTPGDSERLSGTRRAVDDLGRSLRQTDLDQAREQVRAARGGLSDLQLRLALQEQRQWTGARSQYRKARGHAAEGEEVARRLAEELERQFPRSEELLSPADRQRLEELRQQQAGTARRLEEARRELEQRARGQRSPGMMQLAEQGMKQAGQHMERAQNQLGQGEPRDALAAERQAAEQLGQLRQQVSQSRRPREQDGRGGSQDEVVKIPGADEYRAPRDFREDLLEAMKRAAPEAYRERVKRFYEELAR